MTTRKQRHAENATHDPTMTSKAKVKPIAHGEYTKIVEFFGELYERWQDEFEYENFAEYVSVFRQVLSPNATDFRMSSDPFTCTYTLCGQKMWLKASAFGVRYNVLAH